MCACAARSPTRIPPPSPLVTDGCTLFPDGDYGACCETHDRAYWCGGSKTQRRAADRALAECVRQRGHPVLSRLMYLGVRMGGQHWLPTPWRWGFGWPYGQGYTEAPYLDCPE